MFHEEKCFCKYLMTEICMYNIGLFLEARRRKKNTSEQREIHWNIYDGEKHYDSTWQINVNFRGKLWK